MASQRKPRRPEDDLVDWFTISYKTIYIAVALVLVVGGAVYYHYFGKPINPNPAIDLPERFEDVLDTFGRNADATVRDADNEPLALFHAVDLSLLLSANRRNWATDTLSSMM